jgi:hypothetical protein
LVITSSGSQRLGHASVGITLEIDAHVTRTDDEHAAETAAASFDG